MYVVTLPNGRTYRYGAARGAAARALASKTGGTITRVDYGRPQRPTVCPHGSSYGFCDRGACDEGEW